MPSGQSHSLLKESMKNKITITIGIPAFNEEANIGFLMEEILNQVTDNVAIEQIIVSSDGSTDNTIPILRKINDKRIIVLDNKDRKGQSYRQNQIITQCTSDVLILLNADIMLNDQKFIEKLVSPILYSKGDLVSSNLDILSSKKFIENVFAIGYKAKNYLFESLNNGKNLYTCHGAARAFSKRLYKTFRFKDSIGEDAYSYLYCIYNGYKYAYVNNATAYIRYASNIGDHNKQSIRFMESQNKFLKEFGTEFIQKNYHIPKKLIAITGIQFVIKYPVYMFAYVAIQAYTRMLNLGAHKTQDTWEISKSSKNLRIYE